MEISKSIRAFYRYGSGLPVPPYVGHPLDPPLRSRFQSRDIKPPGFDSQVKHLKKLAPNAKPDLVERLASEQQFWDQCHLMMREGSRFLNFLFLLIQVFLYYKIFHMLNQDF